MFRFRSTLLVLLGGLVLLAVFAIGIAAYLNARASAQELSGQVLEQTSRQIELQVDRLLEQATDQCGLTHGLIESGVLDANDPNKLVEFWRRSLAVQSETTSFFLGRERTGEAIGVSRLKKGKLTIWQTARKPDSEKLTLREYWIDDYPTKPFRSSPEGLDIRARPWYVSARREGKGIWTDTYIFLGVEAERDVLGVTYALPFSDKAVRSHGGADGGLRSRDDQPLSRVAPNRPARLGVHRREGCRRSLGDHRPSPIGASHPTCRGGEAPGKAATYPAQGVPRRTGPSHARQFAGRRLRPILRQRRVLDRHHPLTPGRRKRSATLVDLHLSSGKGDPRLRRAGQSPYLADRDRRARPRDPAQHLSFPASRTSARAAGERGDRRRPIADRQPARAAFDRASRSTNSARRPRR